MNKWLIPSVVLIIILGIAIFVITKNLSTPQHSPEELKECNPLTYNGENGIDIVFFSTKEQAEKYSEFFMDISPFSENKDKFNFYYIDSYTPECELYKGIALLCYNRDLIKKATICPNDFIVVIKDQERSIRSSAYMEVLSLNLNHPLTVIAHEFGHAFANFAEEYTPAKIPRDSKNCVKKCEEFGEDNDGCFVGCSESEYYRSIENGIMRTLSSKEFGEFNKILLKEKMGIENEGILTGSAVKEIENCLDEYLLIEGIYSGGEIKIIEETKETGCIGNRGAGDFEYILYLEDGSIASEKEFNPELIFTDAQEEGEEQINGEVFENTVRPFFLKVPLIPKAGSLEILKDDKTLKEINLKENLGGDIIDSRPCKQ